MRDTRSSGSEATREHLVFVAGSCDGELRLREWRIVRFGCGVVVTLGFVASLCVIEACLLELGLGLGNT